MEIELEIRPSGKNEGPTAVVVDEPSKSSSCDHGEEHEEQVGDHLITHEEAIKIPAENDGRVDKFDKDGRYPKRERRLPGEWWKNHSLPQHGEERANMALLDYPFKHYIR